ncbi:MAG: 3'-5' exonuclease [Bacteroidota bacterium]
MNFIVFDLEATCWQDRKHGKQQEIIEIGAVKLDDAGKISDEFCEFVQPRLHPVLSNFCKELTTIEQAVIDTAAHFPVVLNQFQQWIDLSEPYVLCSWGYYDKKQLKVDCTLHHLDKAWLAPHISVKHQYARIKKLNKPVGMPSALKKEGLILEGTHHRGIDDARNIAKIFKTQLRNWELPN